MSIAAFEHAEPSMEEAVAIQKFWQTHHDEFLARYPEEFVAMRDGTVVANNPDLAMLVYDLRDKGLSPRTDVAIEFVSAHSGSLIL